MSVHPTLARRAAAVVKGWQGNPATQSLLRRLRPTAIDMLALQAVQVVNPMWGHATFDRKWHAQAGMPADRRRISTECGNVYSATSWIAISPPAGDTCQRCWRTVQERWAL